MRFVFVVDDVLQIDTGNSIELFEELLIENESHSGYLLDSCLGFSLFINKVGRDGDGQPSTKLFSFETYQD